MDLHEVDYVFSERRRTKVFLKLEGKEASRRDMFMVLVMGVMIESRHDLRSKVGIVSREQVALEEIRMARRISSWLVGEKVLKDGGIEVGGR